ncbi:MAG: hypothetical protein IT453_06685 [Planctomycetes bacterium]|nr:hypothetical protein [Planctomycetota bacterium]
MTAMSGVHKLLFAAPLLAAAGWIAALQPSAGAAATPQAPVTPPVTLTGATEVVEELDDLMASNCTYYKNASMTTVVGQFGYDCCNNPVAWGKKTAFKVCGGCFPCVPPPP